MSDRGAAISLADTIAADFSTIPFEEHEARTLALAYFDLKRELAAAREERDELLRYQRETIPWTKDGAFEALQAELAAVREELAAEKRDRILWAVANSRERQQTCEREAKLREAVEEYLLWEPRKKGHAAAHERLRRALADAEGET